MKSLSQQNLRLREQIRKKRIILAATGASGVNLSISFLKILAKISELEKIFFIASNSAFRVFESEEGKKLSDIFKDINSKKITIEDDENISSPIASGSFIHDGMVILPCSMNSVGAIASSFTETLIHRSADVCLKEERKLIICPRETPLSLIHLKNLTLLREAGATIMPFIPQYYSKPKKIEDLENHFFQRILDHLKIENQLSQRWK